MSKSEHKPAMTMGEINRALGIPKRPNGNDRREEALQAWAEDERSWRETEHDAFRAGWEAARDVYA